MGGDAPDADLIAGLATRRVSERYAAAVDGGDGPLFAAQFTPDGELVAPLGRFVGREAIATIPSTLKRRYLRTFHAVLNQHLRFDDVAAEGETYCIARHFLRAGDGATQCYEMTIRYQDRFARLDGEWLLARRELVIDATRTFPVALPD